MRRREFVTLLGGAAAMWPVVARAQSSSIPVVGFLYLGSPLPRVGAAFGRGLNETGFVPGRDVAIEYRSAGNQVDRLPVLAAELVRRKVAVIFAAGGTSVVTAAKAKTATIPIVFSMGDDPVAVGLVASFNRPGGNVTGISFMNAQLTAKRIGLLHEFVPAAERYALLVNPSSRRAAAEVTANAQAATATMGRQVDVFAAANADDIDAAFKGMLQRRVQALLIGPSPLFTNRGTQIATLAARHALPVMHFSREFVEVGGLMSYGSNIADANRQAGIYVGRILKGEKPADLPVQQAVKFEFVINLQTARALGLTLPPTLLARADEVIE